MIEQNKDVTVDLTGVWGRETHLPSEDRCSARHLWHQESARAKSSPIHLGTIHREGVQQAEAEEMTGGAEKGRHYTGASDRPSKGKKRLHGSNSKD